MVTSSTRPPTNLLCEVCSEIDFSSFAVSAQLCNTPGHEDESLKVMDKDLGTIDHIHQRQDRCNLCALITKYTRKLTGRCKISYRLDFCVSSGQDEFTLEGPHVHTKMTQVQLYPNEEVLMSVRAPWEIGTEEMETQSVRLLFNLQAANRQCQNDPLSNHPAINSRRVLQAIDLALVKRWLSTCEREHTGICPHSSEAPGWESSFRPAFVIDAENDCIVEVPPQCRYVALSYVWGTGKVLKHVVANSEILRITHSLRSQEVPKTIRDAISLVRSIGEKYLWVDALCIVQDDPAMQQAQIAKMDKIYAKALFTIVAACGDHSYAGLPGMAETQRIEAQDILLLPDRDFYVLLCDYTEVGNVLKKATWAHRAWTMQEQLCSGRALVFTETQVYWRCNRATWLEELALESAASTNLEIFHWGGSSRFPTHVLNKHEYFRLYQHLLRYYLQRRLSFQSDRLNAFSGICGRLSAIQDDVFLWGLPQSQFSRCLGWELIRGQHAKHGAITTLVCSGGTVRDVSFPSWSWAAWDYGDTTPWFDFHRSATWHVPTTWKQRVQGEDTWHRSGNEFHPVIDIWICDQSGLLSLIDEPGTHGHWTDTYDTEHRFEWQGDERELPDTVGILKNDTNIRRPGLLYFWTSVVTLDLKSLGEHGWNLLPQSQTRCLELEKILSQNPNTVEAQSLCFIVVSRTDELMAQNSAKSLLVLTVEWKGGIAYYLGSKLVKEHHWVALEDRQWQFVILG
jgi:hypothetical protein